MTGGGPTEDKSTSSKEASVRSAWFWTRANNVAEGTSEVPVNLEAGQIMLELQETA